MTILPSSTFRNNHLHLGAILLAFPSVLNAPHGQHNLTKFNSKSPVRNQGKGGEESRGTDVGEEMSDKFSVCGRPLSALATRLKFFFFF